MKSIIGKSIPRVDGWEKVTGKTKYPSDFCMPNMLYLKMVRATEAHALIKDIDISAADNIEDVYVFTAKDVTENSYGNIIKDQPVFCDKKVRFYGEPVAMVAAPTKALAVAAAEKIKIQYESLPIVEDPEDALDSKTPNLHPNGNLAGDLHFENRDIDKGFRESKLVLEEVFKVPMIDHMYMETEAGISYMDEEENLTVLVGTQNAFHDRREISHTLGIPLEKVRVKGLITGGGFGGKDGNTVQIYLALATLKTGRPAKLIFSREESLATSYKRHPAKVYIKMGFSEDGKIKAFKGKVYFDTGAYTALGPAVLGLGTEHFAGPYEIENIKLDGYLSFTNKPPASAMRGFGAPQVLFATETLINRAAKILGIDSIDIRIKNALETGKEGPFGQIMKHSVGIKEALEKIKESHLWKQRAENKDENIVYGIAAGFLSCGMGAGIYDGAKVKIEKKGERYLVSIGTVEIGQGSITTYVQLSAEALGVPTDMIDVVYADTKKTFDCGSVAASRTTYIIGKAIIEAAKNLNENQEDYAVGEAVFPESSKRDIGIGLPHVMYTFLANAVKMQVNPLTGEIKLLDIVAATEAGKIINPSGLAGQIQGGIGQGVGYALMENMQFRNGQLLQKNLSTYLIPTTMDVCPIESLTVDAYEESGPYGAKGAAEVGTVAIAPAITGGLVDKWDLCINELPISRESIVKQLREKGVLEDYIARKHNKI
ncbi:xanthine dehydrogenase family protein molybdopterin-binding subunit [Clostridium sediminicola]|uniref:xanthine dehydrogenase family protein molybdopterin-binding subunit n=1 Tax=Clostridium sediminicola TaxID=3114879 RepID=UPI0031F22989